jgi:hypothetical protein
MNGERKLDRWRERRNGWRPGLLDDEVRRNDRSMRAEEARHLEVRLVLITGNSLRGIAMLGGVLCGLDRMPQIVQYATSIHRPIATDKEAAEKQTDDG